MKHKTLSIIIPAYNEARTLFTLLEKVHNTRLVENIQKEIIVINDCSKDETESEIQRFMETYPDSPLQYHNQPYNQGKGAALRVGIQKASGEWTVIQDADLEYEPEDFNPLLGMDDRTRRESCLWVPLSKQSKQTLLPTILFRRQTIIHHHEHLVRATLDGRTDLLQNVRHGTA